MKIKIFFSTLFIFSALIFYLHVASVGSAVWGDGIYYFSYVRTLVVDGGLAVNKYSFGASLFWILPFLFVYVFSGGSGYELVYQLVCGTVSVGFGIAGLYICYTILKSGFNEWVSRLTVLGLFLSSNLFFYIALDPINSHAVSFFTSSLLVYLLLFYIKKSNTKKSNWLYIFLLGLTTGMLILIRNQDAIFAFPVLIFVLMQKKIRELFWYLSGICLLLIPQFMMWYLLYGEVNSPYLIRGEKFYFTSPHGIDALFSSNNGLMYTTPVILFCLFGLLLYALNVKFSRKIYAMGIALFLLQAYIIGSWQYWNGGEAYGGRMFISLMPFFAVGLASVLSFLRRRILQIVFISFFALANILNMVNYLLTH